MKARIIQDRDPALGGNLIEVTLSRRNLEELIRMLDHGTGIVSLRRRISADQILYVKAEEDAEHYQDRPPAHRAPRARHLKRS